MQTQLISLHINVVSVPSVTCRTCTHLLWHFTAIYFALLSCRSSKNSCLSYCHQLIVSNSAPPVYLVPIATTTLLCLNCWHERPQTNFKALIANLSITGEKFHNELLPQVCCQNKAGYHQRNLSTQFWL